MKGKENISQETKQVSELESDMTQKLEMSDKHFKITVIYMLYVLMEKV